MSQSSSRKGGTADTTPATFATTNSRSNSSVLLLPNTDSQTNSAATTTPSLSSSSTAAATMASEPTNNETIKTSKLGAKTESETDATQVSASTTARVVDTAVTQTAADTAMTTSTTTPTATATGTNSTNATASPSSLFTTTPLSGSAIPLSPKLPPSPSEPQSIALLPSPFTQKQPPPQAQQHQQQQHQQQQHQQQQHQQRQLQDGRKTSYTGGINDNHLRLPPSYQSQNNTKTATPSTVGEGMGLGPYIDAKNTLQSHSILAELQEARHSSTLLLSTVPSSHEAKRTTTMTLHSTENDETIDCQQSNNNSANRSNGTSRGGDEFYKHMLGLENDNDLKHSNESNSKTLNSSLSPLPMSPPPISALTEDQSEIAADPSISISGQPVVPRRAVAVNTLGSLTITTRQTMMVEAQFVYQPDGQPVNAPPPLPMQAAHGEAAGSIGGGASAALTDSNDLSNNVEATDTITATTTKRSSPIVNNAKWCMLERKWRRVVAIVICLLLVIVILIGSLVSTAMIRNETTDAAAVVIDPVALRARLMTEFINNITLSKQKPLVLPERVDDDEIIPTSVDLATAEETALYFLVYMDPLQLPVPNFTDLTSTTAAPASETAKTAAVQALELIQRYAIMTLSIIPFSADGSDDNMIGRHVCEWRNTVCNKTTVPWRNNSDMVVAYNAVTRIEWSNVGGDGRLLPDLGLLNKLVHFDVSDNSVEGSIPEELGLWTNLKHFDVSNNELAGSLPMSLYLWTALEYFNLHGNSDESGASGLTGSLPDFLGMLWTNLTYFDIGWNTFVFSDWPDFFARWTRLEYFDTGDNALFGTISAQAAQNWTQLQHFNIAGNDIGGSLPRSIGVWTNLRYFDARSNDLSGLLISEIGQWSDLDYFDVSSNSITGTMPSSVGQWTKVKIVNVAANSMSRSLPDSIGNWTEATTIMLGDNRFSGTIPSSIGRWTSFNHVYFGFGLEGSIPQSLCRTSGNRTADTLDIALDCATVNCSCGPGICACLE